MNDSNSSDEIAAALQEAEASPATLPLKRPKPIFVEATLLPQDVAVPPSASSSAGETTAPLDNSSTSLHSAATSPDLAVETSNTPAANQVGATAPTESHSAAPNNELVGPDRAATSLDNPSSEAAPAPLPGIEFFPPPGVPFQGSLTLELRADAPGAEIRYALDATDVDENGTLYDPAQKIFLSQNASLAARALVSGKLGPLALAQFQIVKPAWQKIEPLDQGDPTPHEIGEQSALEGAWKLAAASTRGKLHAHRGLWREDSLAYGLANAADGTYSISIVSDGAGSANLSRVGSKLLCGVALEHLQNGLTGFAPLASDNPTLIARDLPVLRALLVEAATLALQKLREEAARRQKTLGDFSSTLLILVRREWNGAQLCAALQSGDGAIALWDEGEILTLLGEADHGQHSSETKFLTTHGMEAELPARVKFSIRPHLRATLVMSDGIADDFFPETARFPDLVGQTLPLVAADFSHSGAALLKWMGYEKKGSSDDRALIICWNEAASKVAPEAAGNAENHTTSEPETGLETGTATPSAAPQPTSSAETAEAASAEAASAEVEAASGAIPTTRSAAAATAQLAPHSTSGAPANAASSATEKLPVTTDSSATVTDAEALPNTTSGVAAGANSGEEMRDGEQ